MNKVEEQMSLAELIEFAWKNDIRNQSFYYSNGGGAGIRFDKDGTLLFITEDLFKNQIRSQCI